MRALHRTFAGFLGFIALFLTLSPAASASTLVRGYEKVPTDDTWWCDKSKYTPRERIRQNMIKGQQYPPLKGRWDESYYRPVNGTITLPAPSPNFQMEQPAFIG